MFTYSDVDYPVGTLISHHPEHLYRKAPGVSASELKVFSNQSPAHYHHRFLGEPIIRAESAALLLGSMVHCRVLEPQHFDSRYQVQPEPGDDVLVTVPQMKAWLTAHNLNPVGLKADLVERILTHDPDAPVWSVLEEKRRTSHRKSVKPELMDKAQAMADSVRQHPQVQQLMSEGEAEVSVWGRHDDTGLLTKCRPDWLRDSVCLDLKTCPCSSPRAFARSVMDYGYDIQQAHYLNTLNTAGIPVEVFAFIAVENEPPYLTQVYILDSEEAAIGVQRWNQALCDLYECQQLNHWPGYTDEVELTLPGWYHQRYGEIV